MNRFNHLACGPLLSLFKKHIENRLTPYKVGGSLLFAFIITVGMVLGFGLIINKNKNNFIEAIAPHLSKLIEIQDGPQMQRFVQSLTEKGNFIIEVIQNNQIISSSLNQSRIGNKLRVTPFQLWGFQATSKYLVNRQPISRIKGPQNLNAKVFIFTPLSNMVWGILLIALLSPFISYSLISFFVSLIISATKRSLSPIKKLDQAIKDLKRFDLDSSGLSFEISELENIRSTLNKTSSSLKEANERLAKSKAKEMLMVSYKNLIHDLHNPIAALRLRLKTLNKENLSSEIKEISRKKIVELAEQILRQIKSSRSQLSMEIQIQKNKDLRECLKQVAENVHIAFESNEKVKVTTKIDKKVTVPHDPILLGRAVQNILINAFEACRKQVVLSLSKGANGMASIRVSDDGSGLSESDVSLYLQGRGKSTKYDRGGIGLSSANHIVQSHGGKIIYKRSHLGGACFEIQINEG